MESNLEKTTERGALLEQLIREYGMSFRSLAEQDGLKEWFPVTKKEIRTVALYYHRFHDGGLENVMSHLAFHLHDAGCRIVVITDQEPTEQDYPLPEGSARTVLNEPVHVTETEALIARSRKFRECIETHHIDCVIYNAWMVPQLFWDDLAVRSGGAYFIVYTHGNFSSSLVYASPLVLSCLYQYIPADALITLSDCDRVFWSGVNGNVHRVHNPSLRDLGELPVADLSAHRIVWTGRPEDPYKNVDEALVILKKVRDAVPDAELTVCGTIDDAIAGRLAALEETLGITGKVRYTGFVQDVAPYLAESAVFLCTSVLEGYSLSVAEAFGAGLPVVSYAMPYLTLFKESGAVIQTAQNDTDAAAREIITLLQDDALRKKTGSQARAYAAELAAYDFAGTWKKIFDTVTGTSKSEPVTEEEYRAFTRDLAVIIERADKTLADYRAKSDRMEALNGEQTAVIANMQQHIDGIYASKTFRLGDRLLSVPKKVRGLLRKE